MSEQIIDSKLQEKLDYCQQCHLHKDECKCEATYKVTQHVQNSSNHSSIDIMISNWTILTKGIEKTAQNIVVKNIGKANIIKDTTYLNRVRRELKLGNEVFEVVKLELIKKIGESNAS
ncbi:hypothetical protein [Sabulibacter ruber]|uniref:hypothetical protein n=1 Tax=Sabulibacter ruber TaxID=2811901 RepID=UPI001A979F45|nr:hypothetical protein [Sabulibacter ruber]